MAEIIAKLKAKYGKYFTASNPVGIYIAAGGIFLLLAVGVTLVILNRQDTPTLSTDQQDELFASVVANNPQAILDGSTDTDPLAQVPAPDNSGTGPVDNLDSTQIQAPNLNVYNYRHTTTKTIAGPQPDVCSGQSRVGSTEEVYEYFDQQHSFYSTVSKDADGELVFHNVAKYGTDINENFRYGGGTSSAKFVYKPYEHFDNSYQLYPPSYPSSVVSYPVSYLNSGTRVAIQGYFGEDPRVTAVVYINGRKHYEITADYIAYCSPYNYSANTLPKLTVVYTVDAETFAIVKIKHYKGTVSDANLIDTVETKVERAKATYSQVESNFQYEQVATPLTIDYRNYTYSPSATAAAVLNYMKANNSTLLVPVAEFSLQAFDGNVFPERVAGERYSERRDFYPDNAKGTARYQQMLNSRKELPSIYMYLTVEGHPMQSSTYNDSTLDIVKQTYTRYTNPESVRESKANISLDGSNREVTLVGTPTRTTYVPVSYPASYATNPASFPISYPYTAQLFYHRLFFAQGIQVWTASGESWHDRVLVTSYPYKLLNMADSNEYQEIADKITQSYLQRY